MNKPFQESRNDARTGLLVRCLGRFRLQDSDGTDLTPRSRKTRALLAYLALTGRPASRDRLADLLWSDRGEEQAKSSLRQAIYELRHLGGEEASLIALGRDEVVLNPHLLSTDLTRINEAVEADDLEQLELLLAGSEPGLLDDLEGLDPEFDAWLHVERAHEPARTLAAALASAKRRMAREGPVAAQAIVSHVQRLDPCNEEAARLALSINHETGDHAALHRHYQLLSERLRNDYDAAPSPETQELFAKLAREAELVAAPLTAKGESHLDDDSRETHDDPRSRRLLASIAALLVLALAVFGWWSFRPAFQIAEGPPLIAVLPFEQQSAGDKYLAQGLWEDTRSALSQSHAIRVLGRTTTDNMARVHASPQAYRKRLGVTHLLEGSVRRIGNRVRFIVTLTNTSDGVAIWNDAFSGQLGDPFALQEAVARAIEGRLRGRLARGGGKRPEHIATTPEVYALFSEARALLRARRSNDARSAEFLLRRAVALDPNYAPAWASLGAAIYFSAGGPLRGVQRKAEAVAHVRNALTLAPNLAQAHATLYLVTGDISAASERALERAVGLDPGYAEAWLWLGNIRADNYRWRAALAAHQRAVDIDPLWNPAVHNLTQGFAALRDRKAFEAHFAKLVAAGADRELLATVRGLFELRIGDFSAAASRQLAVHRELPRGQLTWASYGAAQALDQLGYHDEAGRLSNFPAWYGPVMRGERMPPDTIGGKPVTPQDFWGSQDFAPYASRAMLNLGRGDKLVSLYRQAFATPDDFTSRPGASGPLQILTASLAVALKEAGSEREAHYLLDAAAKRLAQVSGTSDGEQRIAWDLGLIRAAQGRRNEALRLLSGAVAAGYVPDARLYAVDPGREPALRSLRGDPRFEALRRRILDHIARERAELGPLRV